MTRSFSYDELEKRERFLYPAWLRTSRDQRVRRKPRSPEETALLQAIVVKHIRLARERGELVRVGQTFRIRL